MRGLDDVNALARNRVIVAGDDEPLQRAVPRRLESRGHRGGGFAGADHDGPPFGRIGHMPGDQSRGQGRFNGGVEHRSQQRAVIHSVPLHLSRIIGIFITSA